MVEPLGLFFLPLGGLLILAVLTVTLLSVAVAVFVRSRERVRARRFLTEEARVNDELRKEWRRRVKIRLLHQEQEKNRRARARRF